MGQRHPYLRLLMLDRHRPASFSSAFGKKMGAQLPQETWAFKSSYGDIVIFIDDDILVPPQLIREHVEAHELNPVP